MAQSQFHNKYNKDLGFHEESPIELIVRKSKRIISKTELMFDLPKGYLKTKLALHLTRFSLKDILIDDSINNSLIESESLRLANQIKNKIQELPDDFKKMIFAERKLSKLKWENGRILEISQDNVKNEVFFSRVEKTIGQIIQLNLNYIANLRPDTLYHFGLFREGEKYPFSYISLSFLDRNYIFKTIPFEAKMDQVLVVTRAFNINNSPRNSTSLLLSLIRRKIRNENPNIKAFVTALNPNIFLKGTSLLGSSFSVFALVPFEPLYFKGNYVTRKTLDTLLLHQSDKKYIERKKIKCLPLRWLINAFFEEDQLALKQAPIKKITLEEYKRG